MAIDFLKESLKQMCESPIEVSFLNAYHDKLIENHYGDSQQIHFDKPGNRHMFDRFMREPIKQKFGFLHSHVYDFIFPQFQIENYRSDFVIARISYEVEFTGDEPGGEILVKTPLVVVECDGHDFHERTKEQAQRDKSRDRDLTALGYRVIRFTGSEIYRDSVRCAKEASELLDALAVSIARS